MKKLFTLFLCIASMLSASGAYLASAPKTNSIGPSDVVIVGSGTWTWSIYGSNLLSSLVAGGLRVPWIETGESGQAGLDQVFDASGNPVFSVDGTNSVIGLTGRVDVAGVQVIYASTDLIPLTTNKLLVLNGTRLVNPLGTANSTTFLRGDGSLAVPTYGADVITNNYRTLTTNLFAGALFPLGSNSFAVVTSDGGFAGVSYTASGEDWGECTLLASGGNVVWTNPANWHTSDMATSRTITNGNLFTWSVKTKAAVYTNAASVQTKK